jgi:hypothetical protein
VTVSGDPYVRVETASGEVRLLLGEDDDPATVENCDGFIAYTDGTVRSFSALTVAEVDRLLRRWEQTGESRAGALRVPDLVVLRTGGIDSIVAAVEEVVRDLPIVEIER